MAKKEEHPQPSTIKYMVSDVVLNKYVDKLIDCLQQPLNGVRAKVLDDKMVISFDRELSLDEAFYLGALLGKLEQRLLLGVETSKNGLKG